MPFLGLSVLICPMGIRFLPSLGTWEDEVRARGESHEYKRLFSGSGEEREWKAPLHLPSPQGTKEAEGGAGDHPGEQTAHLWDKGTLSTAGRPGLDHSQARARGPATQAAWKIGILSQLPATPNPSAVTALSPLQSPIITLPPPTHTHTHTHTDRTAPYLPFLAHPIPTAREVSQGKTQSRPMLAQDPPVASY